MQVMSRPRDRTTRSSSAHPAVAVISEGAPSLAFLRSLARHDIDLITPRVVGGRAAAQGSRHGTRERSTLTPAAVDHVSEWIESSVRAGRFQLVAPTSDLVAYAIAQVEQSTGETIGLPGGPSGTLDALFKHRFGAAASAAGMPPPPERFPSSPDGVHEAIAELGYPVVLKGRSHVGAGAWRGSAHHGPDGPAVTTSVELDHGATSALEIDPHLAVPMVQSMLIGPSRRIVSVSGYLSSDGQLQALTHTERTRSWGATGTGSEFTAVDRDWFTDPAIEVVRGVLTAGVFELEVIVDDATREAWALDLNPRGFGQMGLDIARGNDLPVLWYNDLAGTNLPSTPPGRRLPATWRDGTLYYTDLLVHAALGPGRRQELANLVRSPFRPHVGAVWDRRDPRPAVRWVRGFLRHPRGLVRPMLRQRAARLAERASH